jgi:hypothetical protein
MPVLPSKLQDLLDWLDQHSPVFQTNGAAIGLSPAQIGEYKTAALAARAKFNNRLTADAAAKVALNQQQDAVREARQSASDCIRTIKAFAQNSTTPQTIYDLAQIPAPSTPAPLPAPGKPNEMSVAITPTTGAITLSWKALNPPGSSGTSYIVRRRTNVDAPFEFIGVTGSKKFTDSNFIAGPDAVQYTVQGQRSDLAGAVSDILTINFGRSGPGLNAGLVVTSVSSSPVGNAKMAA